MSPELRNRILERLNGGTAGERAAENEPSGSWRRLLCVLFEMDTSSKGRPQRRSKEHLLSPEWVAGADIDELTDVPRTRRALLKFLARWWQESFGEGETQDWSTLGEKEFESLRRIRGLSREAFDRVLLEVGEIPAWPVDRASQRIACRHGWMEPHADYDEWQGFFLAGIRDDIPTIQRMSRGLSQVGREFCGPRASCEDCPLKSLLPATGVVEWENG